MSCEIETENLTVSNSEIIILDFCVSKIGLSSNSHIYWLIT